MGWGTSCLVCLVYLDNIYSFGMEVSRRWRLELSSFGTGSEATPGTFLVFLVCLVYLVYLVYLVIESLIIK